MVLCHAPHVAWACVVHVGEAEAERGGWTYLKTGDSALPIGVSFEAN